MSGPHNGAGWTFLAPGVYADGAGTLHLFVHDMLEAAGWPDTADNRDTLEAAARDLFGDVELAP